MASQKSASKDMLDAYLYSTHNVADHLAYTHNHTRTLRNNNNNKNNNEPPKTNDISTQQQNRNERKDDEAVRKLEADMNKRTNPALLRDALAYQQGLKEGTHSYHERL